MTNEAIWGKSACATCKHVKKILYDGQNEMNVLCGDGNFWTKPRLECDDYDGVRE